MAAMASPPASIAESYCSYSLAIFKRAENLEVYFEGGGLLLPWGSCYMADPGLLEY